MFFDMQEMNAWPVVRRSSFG